MKNIITIEELNNSHSESILGLILPIQQIEFNVAVTLEGQPDLLDIEKYYIKEGGGFWGAFLNGNLVGTIALINTGHKAGAIRKMFVKKEFRGKDLLISQQLLKALKNYCIYKQIDDLYLGTIDVLKAAHRFYEKNGFERLTKAQLPNYFPTMMAENVYYHFKIK
ncbi:GNAT family N-acetyltransferase [Flavobacterium soyangense]|uniref:GNAT family N-acetyltransferase n=1 Tax=Flavobacterium soyangense TaxID=2023265 RepID=A0A930XVD1_9FLAO|nr:GNAT family N-acetyltransferase [Flavobacterium soyangense]MBF2707987.1 GNAT family N-acetyltransferase [Flavobacterium soyangense]